jgi:hypothetical protein
VLRSRLSLHTALFLLLLFCHMMMVLLQHALQVLLKVFQKCGQLAATGQFFKTDCAATAACMMLAGSICGIGAAPAAGSLSVAHTSTRLKAAVTEQLQKSKLLELLPTLITHAALQLQAVAGVWPASIQAADKARFDPMLDGCTLCGRHPGEFAEARADTACQIFGCVEELLPFTTGGSTPIADRLPAAQHLVLASWQYLSTVMPKSRSSGDASTGQDSTAVTASQQQLAQTSLKLAIASTSAVNIALEQDPSISSRPGKAPAGVLNTPEMMTAHAAVLSRHHMECMGLWMVILQLKIRIKTHQAQQDSTANTNLGPGAQQMPPKLAAGQVPASLDRLLQQLGVSSSAAVFAATQDLSGLLQTCHQLEEDLIMHTRSVLKLRNHTKAFLLNRPPPTLPRPLLQELQQQLQMYLLLPSVLLQWVVDKPSSSDKYVFYCTQASRAAHRLIGHYQDALQDGPASLRQHITGQMLPQAEPRSNRRQARTAATQPKIYVRLSADMHAQQLQLLGQLVPKLLRIWATAVGIGPEGTPNAATSTDNRGSRALGADSSHLAGSSSTRAMNCDTSHLAKALTAVANLVKSMALPESFPGLQTAQQASQADGFASAAAAATAAGQLCALLESLCRMEMSVSQQVDKMQAEGPSRNRLGSSNISSSTATQANLLADVSSGITSVLTPDGRSGFALGPLVDPIVAHSKPGSKPCKQLCSLLATMLKGALRDRGCASHEEDSSLPDLEASGVAEMVADLGITDAAALETMFNFHGMSIEGETTAMSVTVKVVCAVIEATTSNGRPTSRQVNTPAGSSSTTGVGRSSSNATSPSDVAGVMSLLALLGRCCLLVSGQSIPESSCGGPVDVYMASTMATVISTKLDPTVSATIRWLTAGSNAAQLDALGYNTDGLMQCLQDAAAASNAARTARHATSRSAEPMTHMMAAVSQLQQHLRAVGQMLISFAHPGACNNPACTTFSGPSESSIVQGSTSRCSSCRAARYCSKSCQRAAWKQHRPVCKALTAAAAGTLGAGKADAAA